MQVQEQGVTSAKMKQPEEQMISDLSISRTEKQMHRGLEYQ